MHGLLSDVTTTSYDYYDTNDPGRPALSTSTPSVLPPALACSFVFQVLISVPVKLWFEQPQIRV